MSELTFGCASVEISALSYKRVRVDVNSADMEDVLDCVISHFSPEEILEAILDDSAILEYLGKQKCKEHFGLVEAE